MDKVFLIVIYLLNKSFGLYSYIKKTHTDFRQALPKTHGIGILIAWVTIDRKENKTPKKPSVL